MTTEAPETTEATGTEATSEGADNASLLGGQEGGEQATTTAEGSGDTGSEHTAEGESNKPPVAPEKYAFTPPEGFEVDQETLTGYEDLAREAGLSQEQFAKVTEYGLKYFHDQLGKQAEIHSARQTGWRNEALGDNDLSDGKSLLPEVMQNAGRVFDQFGGDDLRKALVETGAGNHPSVIRALNQIGKALGAANAPDVGKPAPDTKRGNTFEDMADRIYKGS